MITSLSKICSDGVETGVSLAAISRWRVGGLAHCLVRPSSAQQIAELVTFFKNTSQPYLVIGSTSNLLFSDDGLDIPVIQIGDNMSHLKVEGEFVFCESGVWVPGLARTAGSHGLSGIEHICGIPGTVGGLVCMNGGSQRRGIGENIISVQVVTANGQVVDYSVDNCKFAYRTSIFQTSGDIITSCKLRLAKKEPKTIKAEMLGILRSRRKKFPQKLPNCGSVFVSNPAMYADYGPPGAVIEKCGLKGQRKGDALISPLHANFIVNTGQATANDILYLIHLARDKVRDMTGYDMVAEARFIDPQGGVTPAHITAERLWAINDG